MMVIMQPAQPEFRYYGYRTTDDVETLARLLVPQGVIRMSRVSDNGLNQIWFYQYSNGRKIKAYMIHVEGDEAAVKFCDWYDGHETAIKSELEGR